MFSPDPGTGRIDQKVKRNFSLSLDDARLASTIRSMIECVGLLSAISYQLSAIRGLLSENASCCWANLDGPVRGAAHCGTSGS